MNRKWSLYALLLIFVVFISLLLAFPPDRALTWDVFGYYLYLPAHFIYGDLFLQDQSWLDSIIAQYEPSSTLYQLYKMESGKWVIKYSMGMAIFFTPFFFIAHWIAPILGYAADGFSPPYQYIISWGALLYVCIGLSLLRKVLLRYFSEAMTATLLLLLVLGTNFLQMVGLFGILLSHNLAFSLYVLIFWATIEWHERPRWNMGFLLGLSLGLLTIVRPTEALLILIPILYGITGRDSFKAKITLVKANFSHVLNAVFGGLIGIAPQFIYWKNATGNWFHYAYDNPGEGFEFFNPYTLEFLFSFRKGWFIYTPIMILAVLGLFMLRKKQAKLFLGFLVFFLVDLWVVSSWSCWWYAGGSFSSRSMIPVYALLLIPMGYMLKWIWEKPRVKAYGITVMGCLVVLNLFQTYQFNIGVIDSGRMSKAYYFKTFGKTTVNEEDRDLLLVKRAFTLDGEILDRPERYTQTPWVLRTFEDQEGGVITLSSENLFSPAEERPFGQLTSKNHAWVRVTAMVLKMDSIESTTPAIVMHFSHKDKPYKYVAHNWPKEALNVGEWASLSKDYLTPEVRSINDPIKIYVWNQGGGNYQVDDLKIEVFQPNF
ncbi:MAG: hypothetical protein ACI9FU_001350 [Granulosicoccus sp.]|jgi:hypothetical protein